MLEVVRFWLTKDLKYAKGKPCKPYNSCLGEFFRVRWDCETPTSVGKTCVAVLTGGLAVQLGDRGQCPEDQYY